MMVSHSGMECGGRRSATPLSDAHCPGAPSEQTTDAPPAMPRHPKAESSLHSAPALQITPAMICASFHRAFPSLVLGYQRLTNQQECFQSIMLSATGLQSASSNRSVQKESTLYMRKTLAIIELRKKVVFFYFGM
jgi:hypothetical protein